MKNIIIPRLKELGKIKKAMAEGGTERIYVLSDFDGTLVTALDGKQKNSSFTSTLRNGKYLTPDYAAKAQALYEKFHPIEANPTVPLEEKKKAMNEWWTTHFNLLIKSGLNKKDIAEMVKLRRIKFRDGFAEFVDFLHEKNIPLIIISSSGLGTNVISLYLEKGNKLYNNIYIISNSYEWDKDGYAVAVKKPVIHAANKDEIKIKDLPVFKIIENRENILLLGNNLEDVRTTRSFNYKRSIKICFLDEINDLSAYKNIYDVILMNNSSMNYITSKLLKEICH